MELDVRKTLKDSAYIAVGVGVLGVQNAGNRAKAAQAKFQAFSDDVLDRIALDVPRPDTKAILEQAREAGTKAQIQAKHATTRITTQAKDIAGRAEPLVIDLRSRVEPIAEQLQTLPEHVTKAVDAGRQRVRQLVAS